MANLIPSLTSCVRRMQAGEKRFAFRIGTHLEDDYLCWYELPVGKRQRYSDFIILHPLRGLLLLEVKDWKLETIQKIDKVSTTIITPRGLKTISNPLEQVRQCTYQLINRLEKDPQLVNQSGQYKGRLVLPYGYGVVLSNITRNQFDSTDLGEVLPEHQTICKDEMTESVDPEAFQERLWNMFNVQFPKALTLPQIDRIRWHLFPEVRINTGDQASLFAAEPDEASVETLVPDIVKVMDMQQELLARSLGEGHRVIHGVAGSGKTLILGYRCLYLAKLLNKPILVLCYNITLAARLRELMLQRGVNDKVHIYHFHDWCGEQLRTYNIDRPKPGDGYFDRMVESVITAAEKGGIPKGQYGAVMIDEGHDFEPEWLKLVVSMVDEDTNSLLLLYDDAQSIYAKKNQLDFSLSSVGVQARGRTTVLRLNYRNTDEILNFAYRFASRYLNHDVKDEDHVPLVEPETVGRHGPPPVVKVFDCYESEAGYIARIFHRMHDEQQVPWSDMCVTYRSNWMGEKLNNIFAREGVPCQWLGNQEAKKHFKPGEERIKLMTMHSSKGLEFPVVAVSGVGYMPAKGAEPVSEAKLLYVAMTRSTEKLLITSHKETAILAQLQEPYEPLDESASS
ncbi:MAG: AAA family ATPase [Sedimenticola selenatireducens]|uniref:DNA 3'-5' helicase II n=2 Tax=Sedimenticola selenatireducens TaxID=191960 RepID=A0A557SEN0_9GAMM|nr:AAA family ATPase [Sedimenticola selenatireducens]TVT63746.1 MAG: AAA family ATPase [Sedimenticola selenatireducens]